MDTSALRAAYVRFFDVAASPDLGEAVDGGWNADQLNAAAAPLLVPSLLLSNDALALDQPLTLERLIDGLAADHVPRHTQQLLELSVAG